MGSISGTCCLGPPLLPLLPAGPTFGRMRSSDAAVWSFAWHFASAPLDSSQPSAVDSLPSASVDRPDSERQSSARSSNRSHHCAHSPHDTNCH